MVRIDDNPIRIAAVVLVLLAGIWFVLQGGFGSRRRAPAGDGESASGGAGAQPVSISFVPASRAALAPGGKDTPIDEDGADPGADPEPGADPGAAPEAGTGRETRPREDRGHE